MKATHTNAHNTALPTQINRFIVIGLTAVAIDLGIYYLLFHWIGHSAAKATSFIIAASFSYVCNKLWTFEKKQHSNAEMMRFMILYSGTLFANVSTNKAMLLVTHHHWVLAAFVIATGVSTLLNFAGQKLWVFQSKK